MCEDFPCCGHEMNDCNGQLYGSDESIKANAIARGPYCEDWEQKGPNGSACRVRMITFKIGLRMCQMSVGSARIDI